MKLDDIDIAILELAQGDLPMCERPFDEWADRLCIPVDEILSRLRSLKDRGVIRDIKAILRHRQAGLQANAMVAWAVPADRVDELGARIALGETVSHCYEREGFGRYTIFSMIHGRTRDEVTEVVRDLSSQTGIHDYQVFWSIRELKKSSMKYFRKGGTHEER
ncbi:MAG: Lrp/AsnC family transcriptional regulator [Deltaproteobacteria bacterium]|nr:Lrp/AsnC family transcriptional regulator [Deltaproteobacteria bacterium]